MNTGNPILDTKIDKNNEFVVGFNESVAFVGFSLIREFLSADEDGKKKRKKVYVP